MKDALDGNAMVLLRLEEKPNGRVVSAAGRGAGVERSAETRPARASL